jgi:hypothetical protein
VADLILWSILATLALLALYCLPWIIAALIAIAPTVIAIVIALWIFSVACG